jgi:SAM-dependent methyltransferase
MIHLTKTLDPADWDDLAPELARVRAVGIGAQHDLREWEYSLALRALVTHREHYPTPPVDYLVLDVGGAGSTFSAMVTGPGVACKVVDPKINKSIEQVSPVLPYALADAVVSISTIEHVKEPLPFLEACHRALAPGGLLFLTMDACDYDDPDCSHFAHMRERIYGPVARHNLYAACRGLGFRSFGLVDTEYHGDHLYGNYTFASLALTKEA